MYELRVRCSFEAAHKLEWHPKCCNMHGHSYHVEFVVGSEKLDENGIVMDLGVLKPLCRGIVGELDHTCLNDSFPNPTVEVLAEHFYRTLKDCLPRISCYHVDVVKVTVWETDDCGATFYASS